MCYLYIHKYFYVKNTTKYNFGKPDMTARNTIENHSNR